MNKDFEYFKQNEFDQKISNSILVSLDDNNIFMTSKTFKEIIASLPAFGNHKEKIRGLYTIVNNEISQTFPSKTKKTNFVFGFHKKNENSLTSIKTKKLIYDPTSQEDVACEKILEIFKECLVSNIIKKIPQEPKFSDSAKKVRNFSILKIIKKFENF